MELILLLSLITDVNYLIQHSPFIKVYIYTIFDKISVFDTNFDVTMDLTVNINFETKIYLSHIALNKWLRKVIYSKSDNDEELAALL
ncbi:hypothetical protein I6G82_05095 [Lysinibacillus macroides]|uniref:Uncharacterized protein n=1 Tax=Lysinibacillus macroides TaxID=33935 RepID=A0A0N0CWL2_9BACI|nr:hypothetical protein [Lysinibacillus macroides]KOY83144.1 hypothetical protein ADM90_07580 [Lysinibacillus macroides]QPR68999.1 hypothetical protein I6G82_05095 [Lysinibacillus macroides]